METEQDYLDRYDPSAFDRPALTVDLVLMTVAGGTLQTLLMQRDVNPGKGKWALPGSFMRIDEDLDTAALRVLRDKAHISPVYLEQLYTFGAVRRDPRMRVVTVAYFALLPEARFATAVATTPNLALASVFAPWPGISGGPAMAVSAQDTKLPLAFDHGDILALAVNRLRGKIDYSDVAFALLPRRFTLRALQDVHQAVLGQHFNKPAFRRRMLDTGKLEATGERETGVTFRPAEHYRLTRHNRKPKGERSG